MAKILLIINERPNCWTLQEMASEDVDSPFSQVVVFKTSDDAHRQANARLSYYLHYHHDVKITWPDGERSIIGSAAKT